MRLAGFACPECSTLFAVENIPAEGAYVELLLRAELFCPLCSKTEVRVTTQITGFKDVISLCPKALWAYLNGLGLPEDLADWRAVKELLLSNRVVDVEFDLTALISPGRCVVERLHLDNGKTLHFAPSGAGAMIYMVTEEKDAREGSELRDVESEEGSEEHASGSEAGPSSDVAGD